jgi:hypothetical protein
MNFANSGRLNVILSGHQSPPHPIHAVFTHIRLLPGKPPALADYLAQSFADTDFDSGPPLNYTRPG